MMVVCFDHDAYEHEISKDPLVRQRRRVEKRIREEIKALGKRFGVEIEAACDTDAYGSIHCWIALRTLHRGKGAAWKARKEEDKRISDYQIQAYQAVVLAEAKARGSA